MWIAVVGIYYAVLEILQPHTHLSKTSMFVYHAEMFDSLQHRQSKTWTGNAS